MCNLYRLHKSADEIHRLFAELGHQLAFPEGLPNLEPVDVRITDRAPIVQQVGGSPALLVRRWSWPLATGKPLYNFRSEGRSFRGNRCLVIADGFYEHTSPTDSTRKRKDRWLFTPSDGGLIGIAGIVRDVPAVGEAFTMLTAEPGPDVAPYHHRQIVLLDPAVWREWLAGTSPSAAMLRPTPAGFLRVAAA